MSSYFTDREFGERPPVSEEISSRVWGGLYALVTQAINDEAFGYKFPEYCKDGLGACGCDIDQFWRVLAAELPEIQLPVSEHEPPETPIILDLLEFCARSIGAPHQGSFHSYWGHHHLTWDRETGLTNFKDSVNKLFQRNGIAFAMSPEGEIHRKLDQTTSQTLTWTYLETGDEVTNELLNTAVQKFLSPKSPDRFDATEKLWDVFERIKTIEDGPNKKIQADTLLDRVAGQGSKFRNLLGEEAKKLTEIGNSFHIRHSETSQERISNLEQNDYLFVRLFSLMKLVLHSTGRVT